MGYTLTPPPPPHSATRTIFVTGDVNGGQVSYYISKEVRPLPIKTPPPSPSTPNMANRHSTRVTEAHARTPQRRLQPRGKSNVAQLHVSFKFKSTRKQTGTPITCGSQTSLVWIRYYLNFSFFKFSLVYIFHCTVCHDMFKWSGESQKHAQSILQRHFGVECADVVSLAPTPHVLMEIYPQYQK